MSLSAAVLRAILETVHLLLWLRHILEALVVATKRSLDHLNLKDKSLDSIQAESRKLEKIPQHLAIVFQESELRLEYVAKLLCWSFAAGVQYTSVYDPKGEHGLRKRHRLEVEGYGFVNQHILLWICR